MCAGLQDGSGRLGGPKLVGRRPGNERLPDGKQKSGRQRCRLETQGAPDHNKGEAVGNIENGLFSDSQTDEAHQGTAGEGNGAAHEGHPGEE